MKINEILKKELEIISIPKEQESELKKIANEIKKKILKQNKNIEVKIGGSLAKSTLIKKPVLDIDIFVVFKNEEETKSLGKILRKAGLDFVVVRGSRDYFQVKKDGVIIEIVPIVKNKNPEEAKNVTDFSLKHVDYVKKQIKKNPKLADEIKLAKAFCFANDCYGTENYIQGFNGYSLEILVCYFGSFIKFLKGIKKKRIIDPEKHFKDDKEILRELNASKLQSPVILIDPTYKYRNVCAGLSEETFKKFLVCAQKFLKSPSLKMFKKREIDVEKIKLLAKKKNARFIEINLKTDKQEGDIAGTKMKKFFRFMCDELERKQQKILFKEFVYPGSGKKAKAYLIVKEVKEIEVGGIRVELKEAIKNFKKVRKKIYVKNGKVYAKEKIELDEIFNNIKKFEDEMSVQFEIVD